MKVTLSYGRLYYKDTCDNKINRIFNYAIRPHRNPGPLLNNTRDEQEQRLTGTY